MAHALTTDARESHLNTTTVTGDALVLDALIFSTGTLPVASRSEDTLAEKATLLRLECPVVDGLRVKHLTIGPTADGLRVGDGNRYLIKWLWLGVHAIQFAKICFNTHNSSY